MFLNSKTTAFGNKKYTAAHRTHRTSYFSSKNGIRSRAAKLLFTSTAKFSFQAHTKMMQNPGDSRGVRRVNAGEFTRYWRVTVT